MIGDFSENEESVYAASLLLSWVFSQRTERYWRDTSTPVLTESQFPVLSYGTGLGTDNGGMGTHTMEVSNYKEKQSFVIYREMDATWR